MKDGQEREKIALKLRADLIQKMNAHKLATGMWIYQIIEEALERYLEAGE